MRTDDFWNELFRWILTVLIYGFYIATVFFYFRSDWSFIFTFEYWVSVLSSTAFAFFLRWIWSDKGTSERLKKNEEIHEKEKGKDLLIGKVNSNNLTDTLKDKIDKRNREEKLKEWKNYCDAKIKYYNRKAFWKLFRNSRLERWKQEKAFIKHEAFNLDIVKVHYYELNIDEMMCSFYKQSRDGKRSRGNKNSKVLKSYRTNIITFVAFAVMKAMEVFISSFNKEDAFVLIGQITVFTINIYSGYKLGSDFIDEDYSYDLTQDFVFLKEFLKENGVE